MSRVSVSSPDPVNRRVLRLDVEPVPKLHGGGRRSARAESDNKGPLARGNDTTFSRNEEGVFFKGWEVPSLHTSPAVTKRVRFSFPTVEGGTNESMTLFESTLFVTPDTVTLGEMVIELDAVLKVSSATSRHRRRVFLLWGIVSLVVTGVEGFFSHDIVELMIPPSNSTLLPRDNGEEVRQLRASRRDLERNNPRPHFDVRMSTDLQVTLKRVITRPEVFVDDGSLESMMHRSCNTTNQCKSKQ